MIDVALIGTGGMMPLPNRFLTAMMLRLNGRFLLIDCGEGTQVTLKMLGWGFKNIDMICFTHFHADHISGLPGLLLTIGNSGRTDPIHLIGPVGLSYVAKNLLVIAQELPFELIIHEFEDLKSTVQTITIDEFNISLLAADHRIPCFSYKIELHRHGKFDIVKAEALDIPKKYWSILQKNNEVEFEGKIYTPDMVLGAPRKGIKISYCTDTRPIPEHADFVKDSDLFICEGIYGEDEKIQKAIDHKHMTFSEAAVIAKQACVSELWLTHFSPALTDPASFLPVARNIFKNTVETFDRITKSFIFENEISEN